MEGTIATQRSSPTMTGTKPECGSAWGPAKAGPTPCRNILAAGRLGSGRRVGSCVDAEARGRPGRVQHHRVAQFRQRRRSAWPDSPGSAVQEANVGNDRGVGFVPNGNAGVNDGSEHPGALHPTQQGSASACRQDSATAIWWRTETGLGRFRFVHHLGLRCPEETPKPAEQPDAYDVCP